MKSGMGFGNSSRYLASIGKRVGLLFFTLFRCVFTIYGKILAVDNSLNNFSCDLNFLNDRHFPCYWRTSIILYSLRN